MQAISHLNNKVWRDLKKKSYYRCRCWNSCCRCCSSSCGCSCCCGSCTWFSLYLEIIYCFKILSKIVLPLLLHISQVLGHFFSTHFFEHFPLLFHFWHFLALTISSQQLPQVLGHFFIAHNLEHLPFLSHFWHCFSLDISLQPIRFQFHLN